MGPLFVSGVGTFVMVAVLYRAMRRLPFVTGVGSVYMWRMLVGFIIAFICGYVLFLMQLFYGLVPFGVAGTVSALLLGGSLFVLLAVEMLSSAGKLEREVSSLVSRVPGPSFEPRAAWVLGLGVCAALLVGVSMLRSSSREWREAFLHEVDAYTESMKKGLEDSDQSVEVLRGFFDASEFVSRAEFQSFASDLLTFHEDLSLVQWLPRIPAGMREEVERKGWGGGTDNFRFTELDANGRFAAAGPRSQYFPVVYAYPSPQKEMPLGYDGFSDVGMRPVLMRAMTSEIEAVGIVGPHRADGDGTYSIEVVRPVFAKGARAPSQGGEGERLRGFLVGVFSVDRFFSLREGVHLSHGISLSVFDSSQGRDVLLYGNGRKNSALVQEIPVTLNGRKWKFVWSAASDFSGGSGAGQAMLGALLVFVVAALLAFWFESLAQRGRLAVAGERDRFLDSAVELICIVGFDGYFKRLSPSWEDAVGYSLEELSSKPFVEFVHPDDVEQVQLNRSKSIQGLPIKNCDFRFRAKDGEWRWLSFSASPYLEEKIIYATARDITELKAALDELESARERLDLSLRGSSDGIWDWDLVTERVYFSDRWKGMLGYAPTEIKAGFGSWKDLIHPEDRDGVLEGLQRYLDGETEKFEWEIRMRAKDGSYRWILTRGAAVRDENGKALRMSGAHTDITDRKRAELALQESEERFRGLFNNADISIWNEDFSKVYERLEGFRRKGIRDLRRHLGENEKIALELASLVEVVEVNEATQRLFGSSGNESILQRIDKTFGPNALSVFIDELCAIWEGRKMFRAETEFRNLEGGEIQGLVSFQIPRTASGFKSIPVSIIDITERKRAAEKLRVAHAQLRAVLDSPGDVIIAWIDSKGLFQGWSRGAEAVLGWSEEEIVGRRAPTHILLDKEVEARGIEISEELGRNVRPGYELFYELSLHPRLRAAEWTLRRKDGTTLPIQFFLTPLPDSDVAGGGILGVGFDVSARRELEAALRRARDEAIALANAKSEFLANMSHEIRTPMNGVVGMTNLLLETPLTGEQRDFAITARSSAESLLTIINDILDFSKLERGKLVLEQVEFDLPECVEDTVQMLSGAAWEKKLRLSCYVDPSIGRLYKGDPGRLRQVLVNLVGNAIKFTEAGSVSIRVERADDRGQRLRFEVRDTGIGIAPANQAALFKAFTQADTSHSRRFGGTGLGLAISSSIVSVMGGRIWFESKVGEGSAFFFESRFAKADEPVGASGTEGLRGKRVLVCEDDIHTDIFCSYLRHWGLEPTPAKNLESAREMCAQAIQDGALFDLVILDVQTTEEEGLNHIRWYRGLGPDRPKLLVLRPLGIHGQEEVLEAGADRYLTKPLRQSYLFEAVSFLLGESQGPAEPRLLTAAPDAFGRPVGRLLVAEDNPVNQKVIANMLERIGCAADVVKNGQEAFDAVRREAYALVLMDCQMPVLDGYEAARRIRSLGGGTGRIPIVGITAHVMPGDRQKVLDAGMNDYLAKPVRLGDLRKMIQKWGEASASPLDRDVLLALRGLDDGAGGVLRELVKTFLGDGAKRVKTIRARIGKPDDIFRKHVHSLKGASRSLGAVRIGAACSDLEQALNAGQTDLTPMVEALERAFEECGEALRAEAGLG